MAASYSRDVRKALANGMFPSCSSSCLFDFEHPESVSYAWDESLKCWMKGAGCPQSAQFEAVQRKAQMC
ncbi:unnamed protein product [Effrenium voratum]|uniref:Uncharacterized protein n=1 Tax=Effrenium voratum TaxID=2562239 RepID=A0AA36J3W3_9DINO|nr:unnamed protein product [Effrenium voratum]CAJ1450271.1 unnamed protein product [Effrenium voratum]